MSQAHVNFGTFGCQIIIFISLRKIDYEKGIKIHMQAVYDPDKSFDFGAISL